MTTQEFVKKEAKIYWAISETKDPEENFADGLTKGLEIAEGFMKWVTNGDYQRYSNKNDIWINVVTNENVSTSELLTIFLTEKYGK